MSHGSRITLGMLLIALGLVGTLALGSAFPVAAQSADPAAENHEVMDEMRDGMHGTGTADRMHRMAGDKEMMVECSSMMEAMDGGMMERGMNGRMGGGMMNGGMMGSGG